MADLDCSEDMESLQHPNERYDIQEAYRIVGERIIDKLT